MPEPWREVLETVLARVRDPGGAVHTPVLAQSLLSRLQWLFNTSRRLVIQDFTLTVQPNLQFYTLAEATGDLGTPQGIHVLRILHNNRPLERLTLSHLRVLDAHWPRTVSGRLEGFIQLGFSLVMLWPALETQDTVTVSITKLTTPLEQLGPNDLLDIPSQSTSTLAQMLECLLLLRQRDILAFQTLYQQLNPGAQHAATAQAPSQT